MTTDIAKCRGRVLIMPIFHILPVAPAAENGWVVETTHDSGVAERSIIFASQEEAQAAADSWPDEDWAAV
jgi:hypothetical protein